MTHPSPGVAVVSGGGSGIGREIALALGRRGHPLVLLGRRHEPLEEALAAAGAEGLALPCDVRDAAAVGEVARAVEERWGAAEVVVPAAGVTVIAELAETAVEDFERVVATNLHGTFHLARALLPAMKQRRRGWIFPLVSVAGRQAFPGWSAYCASKWGVAGLAAALRQELAGSGVRVTSIYPGATATDIWQDLPGEWDRGAMIPPGEVARAVIFALEAEPATLVEEIHLGPAGGAL